jgi:Ca2+-binding EF-hand superfamily protein
MKAMTWAVAAALLTAAGGIAISAEPYIPRNERFFGRFDADKNGTLSLAEVKARTGKSFLRADGNGDGTVTAAEIDDMLRKAMERRRTAILKHMDADNNGSITQAELDKFVEAMFNGADANSDGGVSLDEARAFKLAKWRKERGAVQPN